MGLSRAMSSGVSGLQAQQTAMDVIGNNIANVNTNGFRASRTTFRDVYYQTLSGSAGAAGNKGGSNPSQIGYGTQVASVDVNNSRAGFTATGRGMDCYINGEGYFVIKDGAGNESLSRLGTFSFDGSGNLVDGKNNFVCGYPVDYLHNTLDIGGASIDFGADNTKAFDMSGYSVNIVYAKVDATNGGKVSKVEADKGNKTITITYTPSSTSDFLSKDKLKTGLTTATGIWTWLNKGTADSAPPSFDVAKISVADSTDATTKIPETTGMVADKAEFKTGAPQKLINGYGELKNVTIGPDGTITGEDSSGTIQTIGQIALANVPNPDALTLDGNSYLKVVNNSGNITYGHPGSSTLGALQTSALESSNVDLANEFANMIVTQRSFQANSKIITVSDEMLETLVNIKR